MKIPVPLGLRARIMALFCGGVIATQLLTVFTILYGIPGTSYLGEYQQKRMDAALELAIVADLKKAEVEQWIRNIRNDAMKFTWSGTTRRAVASILPSGRVDRPAAPVRENLRILKEVVGFFGDEHTTYRSIRIADARDGAIVFSSVPSEIGRNLSGDDGFDKIRRGRLEEYIDIRKDPLTNGVSLLVYREIPAPGEPASGRPMAVLLAEVDPEEMAALILHAGAGLGESGEVVLVNQDQAVLTTLKKPLKDGTIARPLETRIKALPAVGDSGGAEGIIAREDYAGVPVLAAYRRIRVSPDLGWGIVVKRAQREVLAPLRTKATLYAILSTITVLLVVAISFILARSISRPIRRLSEAAAAVESGDLSVRAPEGSRDELGALGRTFNDMVRRVQGWYGELRLEVAARTAELSLANESLQKEIAERRKSEEARERTNAELEEKNRELEQIVYISSHDLRSPLVNIIGFSREIKRSLVDIRAVIDRASLTDEERKTIDAILRDDIDPAIGFVATGTEKMDRLLAGLLHLSRTGRAKLEVASLDMDRLLGNVLGAFEFQVKDRGVTVLREPLPPCRGDEVQINQVFSNLVDNALKYLDPTRPGTLRITGKEEGAHLVYCVEDNGIGIPAGHQGKIFEIFHRLNPRDSPGEGLGLAIVRKILHRHGGTLRFESEAGKGSKFLVSLPKQVA
jgi:signal transduction histidine kinase